MPSSPTIVLVHGALTDASVWNGVASRLQTEGYATIAPALPLRGLASDAAYLSAFLDTLDSPLVLVGHSYGGSLISHPTVHGSKQEGSDGVRIRALVFVAAFAPDAGESAGELNGRWPGSRLGEETTIVRPYPGGADLYLRPDRFAEVYAADLDADVSALMASAQRPLDPAALGEAFDGTPGWRHVPSWAIVAVGDRSLPTEAQRAMAERAGSAVTEVNASHAVPVSQPAVVARVIAEAARAGAA